MQYVSAQSPIGAIVTERLARARVLDGLGIDFYSDGTKSLLAACQDANIELERALVALEQADAAPADSEAPPTVSIEDLIAHIVETHHRYLRRVLPRLEELVLKIKRVHGANHDELHTLADLFQRLKPELEGQISHEEDVFFPFCMELAADRRNVSADWISQRLGSRRGEHAEVLRLLRKMRELTAGFAVPEDACNTYRMTFNALADLEADTHLHLHKENYMLFARVTARAAV